MNLKNTLLIMLAILATSMVNAQQADRIQRGQRGYVPEPRPLEQGAISIENSLLGIDEKMDSYETEFSLDAFEKEVMKNMIVEFETEKMALLSNEGLEYKLKMEGIEKLKVGLSNDLKIFLEEDEIGRFGELHFATKKMLKEKKKEEKRKRKKKSKTKS